MTDLDWLDLDETAAKCRRSVGTIKNLISKHQLPVKRGWIVRNRQRRRIVLLHPSTVAKLQGMTLFAPVRERPTKTELPPSDHETSHP